MTLLTGLATKQATSGESVNVATFVLAAGVRFLILIDMCGKGIEATELTDTGVIKRDRSCLFKLGIV